MAKKKKDARKQFEESCERMRKVLRDAEALAAKALAHQPEKPGDCWMHLSVALGKLRKMMRPKPGTFAWHTETDHYLQHEPNLRWLAEKDGDFYTPKAVMDVVTANPPFGKAPSAEEAVAP